MTKPFGIGAADEMEKAKDLRGLAKLRAISRIKVIKNYYVSSEPELENHVTRMDLILEKDPFSHDSMMQLERVKKQSVNHCLQICVPTRNSITSALPPASATSNP